jgi:hypothetical protein
MTPGKMTMFKQYKRVLTNTPGLRPIFYLKSTPDGYLLIRANVNDPEVPFIQRISAADTQTLLNKSEPA